jgi:hypothetical protein
MVIFTIPYSKWRSGIPRDWGLFRSMSGLGIRTERIRQLQTNDMPPDQKYQTAGYFVGVVLPAEPGRE